MNRLQKKCVIATAGVHLLLLVILIVGPAFFEPRPKADDMQVLDVIPANLIDAAFNSGVRDAQPPPPAPVRHAAARRHRRNPSSRRRPRRAEPMANAREPVKPIVQSRTGSEAGGKTENPNRTKFRSTPNW